MPEFNAEYKSKKQKAIDHLREREYHFLDKGLFGRAKILQETREFIEKNEVNDFSWIEMMGMEFERETTTYIVSNN